MPPTFDHRQVLELKKNGCLSKTLQQKMIESG